MLKVNHSYLDLTFDSVYSEYKFFRFLFELLSYLMLKELTDFAFNSKIINNFISSSSSSRDSSRLEVLEYGDDDLVFAFPTP